MITSDKLENITKSLINFQTACPAIGKDKKGYGYDYVSLDNILNVVKPVLNKEGIAIIQSVGTNNNNLLITTRLQHVSGEYIEDGFILPATAMKSANNVQQMGASITYGKRYGITAILGISVDEDTNGVTKPATCQANKSSIDLKIESLLRQYKIPAGCEKWQSFNDSKKHDMINYLESQGEKK